MDRLILFDNALRKKLVNKRSAEKKFGEHVQILSHNSVTIYDEIKSLDVKYVIFGIPEDVGVFANHGNIGTRNAWNATLTTLLNIQSNAYVDAHKVLILGHLNFDDLIEQVELLDQSKKKHIKKARKLVDIIDIHVTQLVHNIVSAGKIPIIIGGGHNNAYGNLKGSSLALKKPLNVVNFDAYTDFRLEEGRHSGNGFTYAFAQGFLCNYFVFGFHQNYTPKQILKHFDKLKTIDYVTYEDIEIKKQYKFNQALMMAESFVGESAFGIEVDCDAIINTSSSAQSPSGFSVKKARRFVNYFAKNNNATYLHICEGMADSQTAKLISYLILDFIKNN